jgi:hypothetical protein
MGTPPPSPIQLQRSRFAYSRKITFATLLVGRAGKSATKALRFAPRLMNLVPKTGEPGCQLHDDECDHGYWPALTTRRLI